MANAASCHRLSRIFALSLVLGTALPASISLAQGAAAGKTKELAAMVHQAEILIDNYRGHGDELERASQLLTKVLATDDRFAPAYVEAARLTLVGGHIMSSDFEAGTLDQAEKLLHKAVALNPREAEAFLLLGHVREMADKFEDASAYLDHARSLGTRDPWLEYNYGYYYEHTNRPELAERHYRKVLDQGPSAAPRRRNAYVTAALSLQRLAALKEDNDKVITYGKLATAAAPANDAWVWSDVAEVLFVQGYFDDAIEHARKALSIMDYVCGRAILALSLYGKWATLAANGHGADGERYFAEAHAFDIDVDYVNRRFRRAAAPVRVLAPIVELRLAHDPH
jgi:tetratricopeptide (TPR) repeat protein